jgi:hypothetical protein
MTLASLPVHRDPQRPAAGFTWFVYGASLDRVEFTDWAGRHGYHLPDFSAAVPARLPGYRLAFDVASRSWEGAVASLAESPGDQVEGLALPLPGAARGLVDHREGVLSGLYVPFEVSLLPLAGGQPIAAIAYRSHPSRRLPAESPPSPVYLEALIRGARAAGLSPGWVAHLESLRRRGSRG